MTLALFEHYNYIVYAALMMTGLYAVLARTNLVKKVIGLTLFQTAVFLFYISIGKIDGGTLPVFWDQKPPDVPYENPVPHVLMLTAIVVGVEGPSTGRRGTFGAVTPRTGPVDSLHDPERT